ncbi:MAG TPA: glycosyltransferase family 87 protein [Ktedonobacterales bacterium]|nr:glycosyltransferase family 87 protein [Ktedonobacterales bacterium]
MTPRAPTVAPVAPRLVVRGRTLLVALCCLALLVEVGAWLWFLWRAAHAPVGQYDFSSYYAAALALRGDPHANIYSAAVMARAGAAGHVQVQPPLPYTYPPLFAILLIPLTFLPFRVAARVWMLVNAGLWVGCTLLLAAEIRRILARATAPAPPALPAPAAAPATVGWRRLLEPVTLVALAISALVCLSFAPAQQTLLTGQVDLLVLLPLALVPRLLRHKRERWSGAMIAAAAMLKFTPIILLLYFALRRRWRALVASLVALLVLGVASIAVVGPGVALNSLTQGLRTGTHDTALGHNEALFASVLQQVQAIAPAWEAPARIAALVLLAALAVATGLAIARAGRSAGGGWEDDGEPGGLVAYCMALCGLLLFAPTAWVHHYVWVLPAATVLLAYCLAGLLRAAPGERAPWVWRVALALLATAAVGWMLPYAWDTQPHPHIQLYHGMSLRPLFLELRATGTLLLLAIAVSLASLAPGTRRVAP